MLAGGSLEKIVLYVLVLGIVIVFHELGHFLAARLFDVRVEVFSFGVGKRLFGWRRGETDYRVSLVPLGGYVRMAGDESDPDEAPRERQPRDFESKPTLQKLAIMVAGPVFNFVLAIGLLAASNMAGVEVPAYLREPPRVGIVEPASAAATAGLRPGDLILAVNGEPTGTWEVLLEKVLVNPGGNVTLSVDRDGTRLEIPALIESRTKHAIGSLGVQPCARIVVRTIAPADGPAARAGMLPGDEIAAIDGAAPCSLDGLVKSVQVAGGKPVAIRVIRDGNERVFTVAPEWNAARGSWRIGIGPAEASVLKHDGAIEALRASVATNWRLSGLLVQTVGRLATGRLSMRAMSGPMELADITQEAAAIGLGSVLALISLISLNLGIFNLVPIPILDGGRIFVLLVEAVRGRELERRTKEWILTSGLAMIIVLMALVLWFDLIKRIEG